MGISLLRRQCGKALGEDTDAVLVEIGCTAADIAELRRDKIIWPIGRG